MVVTLSIYGTTQSPAASDVVHPVSVVSAESVAADSVGGADAVIESALTGRQVAFFHKSITMEPATSSPLTRYAPLIVHATGT